MDHSPKQGIEHILRELVAAAYEADLRRMLLPLWTAFTQWERGQMTSRDLSDLILEFPRQADDLWVMYRPPSPHPEMLVAHAIAAGILERASIPAEVLESLARDIRFWEEHLLSLKLESGESTS